MRLFDESSGWDSMRKDLRFTASALAADDEHATLTRALRALLTRWSTLDAERLAAEDALVDANAVIATLDARLDRLVVRLSAVILAETQGRRDAALYKAFFPEAPTEVVRLGLESEITRTQAFFTVAQERSVSRAVRAVLTEVEAVHTAGRTALAARESATEVVARVSLRRTTWREDANRARRSVESALAQFATANELPRDYPDAFFASAPATRTKTVKTAAAPKGPPLV